jgi:quercetin dioxygenase-like cupin family protein
MSLMIALALAAAPPGIPTRTPLAEIPLDPSKQVSRVVTTKVDFLPGQAMPAHLHTVPVICFVVQGDFRVSIGDEPERAAPQGSVTYEPPNVTVHYFRNASASAPAQLQCASLAGPDDKVLNRMLDTPAAK